MLDLVIQGGLVVTPEVVGERDVGVQNGTSVAIASPGTLPTDIAADYSIWEGFQCLGYPVMTILRGKVMVDHGRLVGLASDGQWLRRRVAPEVLARPVV
jgi:dihydroorotase-like cyclic amidohydrolase